jgi:GGDEF domain-containing protein
MPRRNVDTKQTSSGTARGLRVVGPDEFKHELLKFARRDATESRTLSLLCVELRNLDTLRKLCGEESIDRLARALRATVSNTASGAHLMTALDAGRVLVLHLGSDAEELRDALKAQLNKLTVPGFAVRPTFEVGVSTNADDPEEALQRFGCEIDEHGELVPRRAGAARSDLGTKESWQQRYDGTTDRWRRVSCEITTVRPGGKVDTESVLRRARALQAADHPGIEPLLDFWIDEKEVVCVVDAAKGRDLADWLSSHTLNAAAVAELLSQWVSILIYGKSSTPPVVPVGLHERLRIVPADLRLILSRFHGDLILVDEAPSDAAVVEDVRKFAQRLSVPDELKAALGENTIHKIRGALKDAAEKLGAPRVVPKEHAPHA